ncbi:MAG: flavodoxin [Clostridiales bacterium]|nr:flavodoxin [Clostridiales bacterium]
MKKTGFWRLIVVVLIVCLPLSLFAGCGSGGAGGPGGEGDAAGPAPVPDGLQSEDAEPGSGPSSNDDAPAGGPSGNGDAPAGDDNGSALAGEDNAGKTLIVYFSHTGNTERVAKQIHEAVGGDMFQIMTDNVYPEDYDACVEQAKQEKKDGFRPVLKGGVENMDQYDVVFIGYPIWISTMPMALFTFLETYDMSGKTVIPFCTYGGSRFGDSIKDIKKLCPDSDILDGLAIKRDGGDSLAADVEKWLRKIGLVEAN